MRNRTTEESERLTLFRRMGIMTAADLRRDAARDTERTDLVDGFIRPSSVNLFTGDSGIGKTSFVQQLALSVASGKPFLGRAVHQGRVLFIDGESDRGSFLRSLDAIAGHLELPAMPDSFLCWSPNWTDRDCHSAAVEAVKHARASEAALVIVDPLRVFFPDAESKAPEATAMFRRLRAVSRETNATWILLHHVRKTNKSVKAPDLATEPAVWLQEAAGSRALINQSDTRLGIEARAEHQLGDLLIAGVQRGIGVVGPWHLERATNDDGDPIGYSLVTGIELLNPSDRGCLLSLPPLFRFRDVKPRLASGRSDSNAMRFLRRCIELELVSKVGGHYMKADAK